MVDVDVEANGGGGDRTGESLRLVAVDLTTEGTFRCEAITDETFQVVRAQLNLVVFGKWWRWWDIFSHYSGN